MLFRLCDAQCCGPGCWLSRLQFDSESDLSCLGLLTLQMPMSSVAVCLVIFFSLAEIFECRGVDNVILEDFGSTGMKAKRSSYDSNCFGSYNRELSSQLNRVCDDCYHLYRSRHVSIECRHDCYTTEVFVSCLKDLMMHDFIKEYMKMALMVSGKK
ncbi:Crustacean hyperglycemic hormone [Armadillidium vulgare]|nr:Crustacean hyperglycemic hormone [Armadillidium vulgare]